tara:strand:+ start:2796 stop:3368 length:573 start_codon:yes stop_codon:yes gene_type:complete
MRKQKVISNFSKVIDGPLILQPDVFSDERGFFFESWNRRNFDEITSKKNDFVQDNHSRSVFGVLRGLHFQINPKAQSKLIRCIRGEIFDVIVDLRSQSATYGNWAGVKLDSVESKQLWIPTGFAHGFLVMSNEAEIIYKVSDYWDSKYERVLRWNDSHLEISWPLDIQPKISFKDSKGLNWRELQELKFF